MMERGYINIFLSVSDVDLGSIIKNHGGFLSWI